jgi:hypothetical protein
VIECEALSSVELARGPGATARLRRQSRRAVRAGPGEG